MPGHVQSRAEEQVQRDLACKRLQPVHVLTQLHVERGEPRQACQLLQASLGDGFKPLQAQAAQAGEPCTRCGVSQGLLGCLEQCALRTLLVTTPASVSIPMLETFACRHTCQAVQALIGDLRQA